MAKKIERDGVRLVFDVAGRGEPVIVLVHGWAGDRSYFAPQFERFASSHAVLSVDLRGHGESDAPEPGEGVYEVETLCDDVLAIADDVGCDRPVVVGHSLGALVALACGARGDAVRAVVMVDPAPIVNQEVKTFLGNGADSIEDDFDGSWRRGFVGGMFMETDRVRRDEIIEGMAKQSTAVAAATLRAIATFDGASALAAISVPLLSIGSASPTNDPSFLRAACPSIVIGQTVGAGHFNQLEVPEQVNVMIERFLTINNV